MSSLTRSIARWFAQVQSQSGTYCDVDGLLSLDDYLLSDIGLCHGERTYMAQHHRLPDRRSDAV